MKHPHCKTDAKHIRHFLNLCEGNWHSCIYVWCRTCNAQESCENSGFLFHPDETGSPCILPLSDAALLFPRIPEPTECTGSMSIAAFTELYLPYLAAQKLPLKPCPIPALLRLQENKQYDWKQKVALSGSYTYRICKERRHCLC